jgi:hypothetical protein
MPAEQDELKSKVAQAEAAVVRAQKVYEEAQPGSTKDSYLQLLLAEKAFLLAEKKALEQWTEKDLLQLRAAAGVAHKHCPSLSLSACVCLDKKASIHAYQLHFKHSLGIGFSHGLLTVCNFRYCCMCCQLALPMPYSGQV